MQCQQLTKSVARKTITLFVTISDDDGAEALENESAEVLNPPTVFKIDLSRATNSRGKANTIDSREFVTRKV